MFGSGHFDAKYLVSIMLTSLKAQNISSKSSFLNVFLALNFIGSACTESVLDISVIASHPSLPTRLPDWTSPSCEACLSRESQMCIMFEMESVYT